MGTRGGRGRRLCILAALLALLCAAGAAEAQSFRPHVVVGATRAHVLDLAKIERSGWDTMRDASQSRTGFVVGVGATTGLAGPLQLRGDAVIGQRGFRERGAQMRATYVELPVLLELAIPWKGGQRLLASAGVAPSHDLFCFAETSLPVPAEGSWVSPVVEEDCSVFRSEAFDLGLAFGAGYGPIGLFGWGVTPELRWVSGQLNISEEYALCCCSRHRTVALFLSVSR